MTDAYSGLASSDVNETKTNFSSATGRGTSQAWFQATAEGLALFERIVCDLVAPYARTIGAEGYRFNVDLYAKRFGLNATLREIVTEALCPLRCRVLADYEIAKRRPAVPAR